MLSKLDAETIRGRVAKAKPITFKWDPYRNNVTRAGLDILGTEMIDESVINLFLRTIVNKAGKCGGVKRYAHLTSHFLDYYKSNDTHKAMKDGHLRHYDVVLCPVNVNCAHWILVVLYPSLRVIESYDSLDSSSSANSEYRRQFQMFLEKEYEAYTIEKSVSMQMPTQGPESSKYRNKYFVTELCMCALPLRFSHFITLLLALSLDVAVAVILADSLLVSLLLPLSLSLFCCIWSLC